MSATIQFAIDMSYYANMKITKQALEEESEEPEGGIF